MIRSMVSILLLAAVVFPAQAQVTEGDAGVKAGQLLGVYVLMEEFGKSRCGYTVDGAYSLEKGLNKLEGVLTATHMRKIRAIVASEAFDKERREFRSIVRNGISDLTGKGMTMDQACTKLGTGFHGLFSATVDQWNAFVPSYRATFGSR